MKTNDTFTIADLKRIGYPCPQCKYFNPDYEIHESDMLTFSETGECISDDFSFDCPFAQSTLQLDGGYNHYFPPLSDEFLQLFR